MCMSFSLMEACQRKLTASEVLGVKISASLLALVLPATEQATENSEKCLVSEQKYSLFNAWRVDSLSEYRGAVP